MRSEKHAWNSELYDQNHSFVSRYGESIVELLAPQPNERILDLGCGTGDLAKQMTDLRAQVVGVDKSQAMIEKAQQKYPDIPFQVLDARSLPFHNEFDAVFSNAALHWILEPAQVLTSIYGALVPGGRFVAEFGGKGNVNQIVKALLRQFQQFGISDGAKRLPWYFPSIGEYTSLMEAAGLRVTFAHHFDRPTPLEGDKGIRNWLNMFGDAFFQGLTNEEKEQLITETENCLKEKLLRDGQWLADYKRIRVIGIKE